MLRAWLVDANFIFVLVSISSYVSFSLAYIRLFHPMNVYFFTSLGAYLFSSCSSVTIIYFFLCSCTWDLGSQCCKYTLTRSHAQYVNAFWVHNIEDWRAFHVLLQDFFCGRNIDSLKSCWQKWSLPMLQKQGTVMRESLPAGERLPITLRFVASCTYRPITDI